MPMYLLGPIGAVCSFVLACSVAAASYEKGVRDGRKRSARQATHLYMQGKKGCYIMPPDLSVPVKKKVNK